MAASKKTITALTEYKLALAYYAHGKNLFKDQKVEQADNQIQKALQILQNLYEKIPLNVFYIRARSGISWWFLVPNTT